MFSSTPSRSNSRLSARSLTQLLEPRLAVEEHFARTGHTYRHGRLHRQFENRILRPLLKTGLEGIGLYARGVRNALSPIVPRVRLEFQNLPAPLDGFEILHLSDLHIDGTNGLAEVLVPILRNLRPDLCVMTGDYRFEDRGSCAAVYPLMKQVVSSIQARYGVFGILGNHDAAEIALGLEELGVRMLVNEAVEISTGWASFWLAGVDDPFDYQTDDLDLALNPVPEAAFCALLAHAPELYRQAARAGVDLYLTGHTHAGQIRLPGVGSLRHNAACPREYAHGHWKHGEMQGYTSAGVGCSSLPVRFACPPELVMLQLTRPKRSQTA